MESAGSGNPLRARPATTWNLQFRPVWRKDPPSHTAGPMMTDTLTAPDIVEGKSAPTVSFVSLGCPKALVDSERILTQLRAEGYGITRNHQGANLVIVNTCGFLDSAK